MDPWEIKIEVDGNLGFGHAVFGRRPPIPDVGTTVQAPGEAVVTLERLDEHRDAQALATFALLLGIGANISNLIQFSAWLAEKLKSNGRALRINGRAIGRSEDEIKEFLTSLAEDDKST